jgi:thiol-disulfide isomerase/thioredoxin
MSNISFLSSENFVVMGSRQKTLGISIPGNVLVFFKMQRCNNCAEFEPIFASLSKKENRVTHAILDVTDNRDVVISSRDTNTPIAAVPVIILYINGRPHAKFNGTKNIPSIQNFITKALQSNMSASAVPSRQQQFMPSTGGKVRQEVDQMGGNGKAWLPDIGTAPSMKGKIKGDGRSGYAQGANLEEDDEPRLSMPDSVTPYNAPWEAELLNQDM